MINLQVELHNIKNIKNFKYTFNFDNGIYALVGENAVGKSTIMAALASTVYPKTINNLSKTELTKDSYIKISCCNKEDFWQFNEEKEKLIIDRLCCNFEGIYEGSIFSGTRFDDMQNIDKMIQDYPEIISTFTEANTILKEALSYILHNEKNKYNNLYKLHSMDIARRYGLNNMPYFNKLDNGLYISKFKMSSGECMLISLLNFITVTILKSKHKMNRKVIDNRRFIFIDEVELALHPSSIVRLFNYLNDIICNKDITVLFSTHSSELIKMINPNNLYYLENREGNANIMSPCYPQFAIRSLYDHDGYDCTILVEDKLAEIILKKLLDKFRIENNLLINVLPLGAWGNTLAFQKKIIEQNLLGRNKFVFSILDGDVMDSVNAVKDFRLLKKLFLPIKSLEKYIYDKIIIQKDDSFIKLIGKKFFIYTSFESLLKEFHMNGKGNDDVSGKSLYGFIIHHLSLIDIDEKEFIKSISEELFMIEDFTTIKSKIIGFINDNFSITKKAI